MAKDEGARSTVYFWRIMSIAAIVSVAVAGTQLRDGRPADPTADRTVQDTVPGGDVVRLDSQKVAVLIVSSKCAACRSDEFQKIARSFMARAREQDGLVLQGVSIDNRPKDGARFLEKLGVFNEMTVGGGWANAGAQKYIWGDLGGGEPAIPQLVFVTRTIRVTNAGINIENARVHKRLIGVAEIAEFMR